MHETLNVRFRLPAVAQSKSLLDGGNPKIDPALRRVVMNAQSKSIGATLADAREMQVPVEAGLVAVVATANSQADVSRLRERITADGGQVIAVVDEAVLARVPPDAIERIGAERTLEYLAAQGMFSLPPSPRASASAGSPAQGVLLTKANLLHEKGTRGAGIKVGIIDFGFTGYQAMQSAGALPAPKALKAFGKDQGWDRVSTGTPHGAACAEIIHAMAPEAELYIASIGDGNGGAASDEIIQAGMWLAEQHVDIVSFSGGGHGGPHNGKDLLDKLVEEVVGKGILWVNAAGNEGDSHWSTTTQMNSEKLVMANDKPFLLLQATGAAVKVLVSWDDWGPNPLTPTATQDFDVFLALVDPQTGNASVVNASQNPQNGRGAPIEVVYTASQPGQVYALFIQGTKVTRPVRMHVYSLGEAKLFPTSPVGSIGIPATSSKALAVGAVSVGKRTLEAFSSQGPTDDDRPKPEISAPDGVDSQAYKHAFLGTSAACPHVAGFAALVRQMRGRIAPQELARIITAASAPLQDNRGAGGGLIDASKLAGGGTAQPSPTPSPGGLSAVLDSAGDDNELGVKVVVGRPEYKIGDGLKIGYRANVDAYCLLVHRGSSGELTPLEPAAGADLRLAAGQRYTYPPDGTNIRITGPPGTDQVGLICSPGRIRLEGVAGIDPKRLSVSVVRYRVVQE